MMNKNKTIIYRCYNCNSLFKITDLNFDYTEAIYCINCGHDTLEEEKKNQLH
jgi:rRNA maturation endonuclease Nob1